MEALNKESKFAAPVLTWAQKRSDLKEKSTVGKFVRSSLQGLNHEDVLLKLKTKIINNCKGHAFNIAASGTTEGCYCCCCRKIAAASLS